MSSDDDREYNLTVAIFSVSSGMVGVCLTAIGLLQVLSAVLRVSTLLDELLAVDAVVFLGCSLLTFSSFRMKQMAVQKRLRNIADGLLFVGLLMMVIVCGLISSAFI